MRVAIIYHHFPHYRKAVLQALKSSQAYNFEFWGSESDFHGIRALKSTPEVPINQLTAEPTKRGYSIRGYSKLILTSKFEAYIIIGNPNIAATWIMAIVARLTGKKVLFWTHGWLRTEPYIKRFARNSYYKIAHSVLVYGERAKSIGISEGYPEDRIHVIFNSLDFSRSTEIFNELSHNEESHNHTKQLFPNPNIPLLTCSARLTPLCRHDILIKAAYELAQQGLPVNILLIGDGPEKDNILSLAQEMNVSLKCFGECYDEAIVGRIIYDSDVTVTAGKAGLTAIHSLTYGTPVFSHNNLNMQMPEVESIQPGVTGDLFEYNDSHSLAERLKNWFSQNSDRSLIRKSCRAEILARWNPETQRREIETALRCLA